MATIGGKLDNLLESNKGITSALTSGFRFAKEAMSDDSSVKSAFNSVYKTSAGNVNWGNVAGTAIGASAAARIASGGGIYRNSRGEVDLIGIPFV